MAFFLDLFSPEAWRAFHKHGASVGGVVHGDMHAERQDVTPPVWQISYRTTTMMRLLLALLVSVSFAAHADNIKIRTWDAPLPVTQMKQPNGAQFCSFGLVSGTDLFMVFKSDSGSVDITFSRNDWKWNNAGRVSFNIDGRTYTATMKPEPTMTSALSATLNDDSGRDFMHDIYNGSLLYVIAGPISQTFSLIGTASTIAVLNRCADSIMAERGNTPTSTPSLFMVPTTSAVAPTTTRGEASLVVDGGTMTVKGIINGITAVTFELDSGASMVILPRSVGMTLFNNGTLTRDDYVGESTSRWQTGSRSGWPNTG